MSEDHSADGEQEAKRELLKRFVEAGTEPTIAIVMNEDRRLGMEAIRRLVHEKTRFVGHVRTMSHDLRVHELNDGRLMVHNFDLKDGSFIDQKGTPQKLEEGDFVFVDSIDDLEERIKHVNVTYGNRAPHMKIIYDTSYKAPKKK